MMLMKTKGPPQDWNKSAEGIVTLGKFLALKRSEMSPEDYLQFIRADVEIDDSSASKLIKIAEHPILSNPENFDRLPQKWALLYELRFFPDAAILEGLKNNTLRGMNKYQIWEARGVKKKRWVVNTPDSVSLSEHCRAGMAIEANEGLNGGQVAKRLGIGDRTYRLMKSIIMLSERPELSEADSKIVEDVLDKIDKTRNVRTYYAIVKPLIDQVWGTSVTKIYNDKAARKRIEAFRGAITILYDTCERASRVEQPLMPVDEIDAAINELTEAGKIVRKIAENLRRVRND